MITPIEVESNMQVEDIDVEETTFAALGLREDDIEEFIRQNIELVSGEENLLIVGRQVSNTERALRERYS